VLAGGLVFLAVLAERYFGFELGRRQWTGIGLVAASLTLLTLTGGGGGGGAHSGYSLAGMIVFEGIAVGVGLLLVFSHLIERIRAQPGVLLGIAAGLGFGISDVAIKALSGDLDSGPIGLLSPWSEFANAASAQRRECSLAREGVQRQLADALLLDQLAWTSRRARPSGATSASLREARGASCRC
jgi:drug/metabolite transporter (DMT)-like permease